MGWTGWSCSTATRMKNPWMLPPLLLLLLRRNLSKTKKLRRRQWTRRPRNRRSPSRNLLPRQTPEGGVGGAVAVDLQPRLLVRRPRERRRDRDLRNLKPT